MKKMLKASVLARGEGPERIEIFTAICENQSNKWIWRDEDGECEVSGRTKNEALKNARRAWAGDWDFRLVK